MRVARDCALAAATPRDRRPRPSEASSFATRAVRSAARVDGVADEEATVRGPVGDSPVGDSPVGDSPVGDSRSAP